jgi:hypothetical protein
MNAETVANVRVGTVLIPDSPTSRNMSASGIQCLEANEQGFRFRRMNLHYEGETFFLTRQALCNSLWIEAPIGTQLRFL